MPFKYRFKTIYSGAAKGTKMKEICIFSGKATF